MNWKSYGWTDWTSMDHYYSGLGNNRWNSFFRLTFSAPSRSEKLKTHTSDHVNFRTCSVISIADWFQKSASESNSVRCGQLKASKAEEISIQSIVLLRKIILRSAPKTLNGEYSRLPGKWSANDSCSPLALRPFTNTRLMMLDGEKVAIRRRLVGMLQRAWGSATKCDTSTLKEERKGTWTKANVVRLVSWIDFPTYTEVPLNPKCHGRWWRKNQTALCEPEHVRQQCWHLCLIGGIAGKISWTVLE